MPVLRKLTEQESAAEFANTSNDISEYVDKLRELRDGGDAEVIIEEHDSRRAIVRRFNAAAKQLNVKLRWKYADDNKVYLRVLGSKGDVAKLRHEEAAAA